MQWGQTGGVANITNFTVTFPIAYSTVCLFATNIPTINNQIGQAAPVTISVATTNFVGRNNTGIVNTFRWFAVGY